MTLNDLKNTVDQGGAVRRFDAAAQSNATVYRAGNQYAVNIDGELFYWPKWSEVEQDLGSWVFCGGWQECPQEVQA